MVLCTWSLCPVASCSPASKAVQHISGLLVPVWGFKAHLQHGGSSALETTVLLSIKRCENVNRASGGGHQGCDDHSLNSQNPQHCRHQTWVAWAQPPATHTHTPRVALPPFLKHFTTSEAGKIWGLNAERRFAANNNRPRPREIASLKLLTK